jgi:cytochrome c-type biogenesis protein CcmE
MRIKPRFIIGAAIIVVAVAYLIVSGIRSTSEYYLTVAEAAARQTELAGQPIRVAGRVKADGIAWDSATLTLKFQIEQIPDAAADGDTAIKKVAATAVGFFRVVCAGQPKPDMFAPGRDVIVEGRMDKAGLITATQVLTSCPSKYRPKQAQ